MSKKFSLLNMKNKIFYLITILILAILLFLLFDPFMYWMPGALEILILLFITVCIAVWTGFIMTEKAIDEREVLHKFQSGRVAYLLGIGVLTLALILQVLKHNIDPWIPVALFVMIASKVIARLYSETYK